ncbi:MAG: glycosyltransferase [Gemmiger sp.]|uniref:glycosyltransferase n=1 Tax=Gemmiger sp. TaxID=2049027 RepID=UPI002E795320|nr:glycosyltransferase [Gemmiger sp.]MEE0800040.1 glycosyltransferase [Gemmiger sp.]
MRILFILDSVENPTSANVLLGHRLAAALAGCGHQVRLLELWDGARRPAVPEGLKAEYLAFPDERMMNAALENGARQGSALPLRLLRLMAHPTAVAAAFRQLILHRPHRVMRTIRELEKLDAAEPQDVVCAVCAPYRSAFALEQARITGRRVLWQLDPYASNRDYRAPGGYPRELALLDRMDASFVTRQARKDYEPGAPLAAASAKIHLLDFPALVPPAEAVADRSGSRRCVFCGSLYPGLREPGFALELFSALGAQSGWTLVMAGGGWKPFAAQAERAEQAMGGHLQIPGPVPLADARALLAGADVLLNLGNAVENQLPSKLFEYFAAGKPVLHLAMIENDPALPYLARYPLSLVLHRGQPDAADRLAQWLDRVAGKRLSFAEVEALFPELRPDAVARQFLNAL